MKTSKIQWTTAAGWSKTNIPVGSPDLILVFGSPGALEHPTHPIADLLSQFPDALCVGCSTAGEIFGSTVNDGTISAALVKFDGTRLRAATRPIQAATESHAAGLSLAQELIEPDLRHVLIFSDGLTVNGTDLTDGLREGLPPTVGATGGLAGDGADFRRTLIVHGDQITSGMIVAVGFYGTTLEVHSGSAGGWQSFGPKRLITRSSGNVLYELDNQPALPLYKRYLGDRAAGLPATGLLFPLEILANGEDEAGLVRTILAVNEETQSLTFAGDMPQGHYARLMKASHDRLVFGAETAAQQTEGAAASLAVLVSCVGRKLVMGQRVEEEVEAVLDSLTAGVEVTGFYSYGEISPGVTTRGCELHNQTMTLTTFNETA